MCKNIDEALRNAKKVDISNSTFEKVDNVLKNLKYRKEEKYMKPRSIKYVAVAATLAVFLLTGAAFAADWFGLRDLVISSRTTHDDGIRYEMISLQGYANSNEYKALVEWIEFCDSYDQDRSILNEIGNNDTGIDMVYRYYGAYTPKMVDKIDEIIEKYGLSLLGESIPYDTLEEFMARISYGNFVGDTITTIPGYAYENGTFQFEGYIADYDNVNANFLDGYRLIQYDPDSVSPEDVFAPEDEFFYGLPVIFVPYGGTDEDAVVADISSGELTFVPYDGNVAIADILNAVDDDSLISFQFRYCTKGVFDYIALNINNFEDYTQWSYETACGITVNLAQSTYKSLIIVELDNAFVTVNILGGSDEFSMPELEAFADTLDLTLLK